MSNEDIEKTAAITLFALFEYLFNHFRLRNSSAKFQCFMDNIFMDRDYSFVYKDDISVSSEIQS